MAVPTLAPLLTLALGLARDAQTYSTLLPGNVLVSPLIGVRLGGWPESCFVPVLHPWYAIGGSPGVAFQENCTVHQVPGLWEGLPVIPGLLNADSYDLHPQLTLSVGCRYKRVHEVYPDGTRLLRVYWAVRGTTA